MPAKKRPASDISGAERIKVGDNVPAVALDIGFPPEQKSFADLCKGRKVVLVGLPGAFTPVWSMKQVPGYLAKQDELKAKGVAEVIVYCVNDGAVMKAWAKDQGIAGSMVTFYADTRCEFTSAIGMELNVPDKLGNTRCQRFSMLIDDGVVKSVNVAEDGKPDEVTFVETMLEQC